MKKKQKLPTVVSTLGVGERQMITYVMPRLDKEIVCVCQQASETSPCSKQFTVQMITLDPCTATPTQVNCRHEMIYVPLHGLATITIWFDDGKPKSFHLHMGEGPVVVPLGHPHSIRTFKGTVSVHRIVPSRQAFMLGCEMDAKKLCRNEHLEKIPSKK